MKIVNARTLCVMTAGVLSFGALAACDGPSPTAETAANDTAAPPASTPAPAAQSTTASCDRQCLLDTMDTYIQALVDGDLSAAPLAGDVRFVENITPMRPGQGLWQTASDGPDGFAIHVPDPVLQTAGFIGVIERDGESGPEKALLGIRLQLEGGRIVEVEHLVTGLREDNMERLTISRPGFGAEIPAERRLSHDDLIRIGASYYDALDDNDGTLMPFAPDCQRHENGMITAGPNRPTNGGPATDCEGQLTSNVMAYIDSLDNRRVFAADPVTGTVMGLSHFRHAMAFEPYTVTHPDGSTSTRSVDDFSFGAFDLPAAHIFKIGADGLVHEIEAIGFMTDYMAPTGWE